MAKKKPAAKSSVPVDAHKHVIDTRPSIPTREMAAFADDDGPQKFVVNRNRSLDPQIVWKGKDEQDAKPLEVPVVPIHVQEKIHPQVIVEDIKRRAASKEPAGLHQGRPQAKSDADAAGRAASKEPAGLHQADLFADDRVQSRPQRLASDRLGW